MFERNLTHLNKLLLMDFIKKRIKFDFGAELLCELRDEALFFKTDKLFYKFVLFSKANSSNTISQFYLLRYELVELLKRHLDSNTDEHFYTLSSGEKVKLSGPEEQLEILLLTNFSDSTFNIVSDIRLKNNLISDLNILNSNKEQSTPKAKEKLFKKLLGKNSTIEMIPSELSEREYEVLNFESALSLDKSKHSLTAIYKMIFRENLSDTSMLKFYLMANFEYVYNRERCDCGDDGCFFDLLKQNQLYFFKNNYNNEMGEVDSVKVENDFDEIWSSLSMREKVAMNFLYHRFGNATLLNLGFLRPTFDMFNYQYLMCFPYQPDSEDEQMVREVSTLANYLVKMDN
jgi:hypothetical protein